MPKVQWDELPAAIRDHLVDRARERKLSFDDLKKLKYGARVTPRRPTGPWYKDLGPSSCAVRATIQRLFSCRDKSRKERKLTVI